MTAPQPTRTEKDFLGELEVPADAYWGVNTQRAIQNFQISGRTFPPSFLVALAQVKQACLQANEELENIDAKVAAALHQALAEFLGQNKFRDQFPIDIFQTGSGTQTNMNMNEVLANRANEILGRPMGQKSPVHPNDHVNRGQSSNDVIPTAMHLATLNTLTETLIPQLEALQTSLNKKIEEFQGVVKVGRTHLQDAVPISLATEFQVYHRQITTEINQLDYDRERLSWLPIGGTAVGTGLNAPPNFAPRVCHYLSEITGFDFKPNPVLAEGIASHNVLVGVSGTLRQIAATLLKLANDIRWMGSGPRAGLGELILPPNEPGSSIMPGKVNPTQSEALIQVCLQVMGNDAAIAAGESFGSILDLNVCKPLIIVNLLDSIHILAGGIGSFVGRCLDNLQVNTKNLEKQLGRMLMVVTKLNPLIGYDKAAEIAKQAFQEEKTIKEVILERGIAIEGDLDQLLDPSTMI